eukprot:SAG22_NODE_12324_length_447_cov_0.830460_1_plen_111_part_00
MTVKGDPLPATMGDDTTENPLATAPSPPKKKTLGMREAADVARAFPEIDTDDSGQLSANEVREGSAPPSKAVLILRGLGIVTERLCVAAVLGWGGACKAARAQFVHGGAQ